MTSLRGRFTVLVVDDEQAIRFSLKAALAKAGYEVVTADNAREALRTVLRGGVHVVVSDYNMPDVTGLQLLRQVREQAPDVVFMMMTAYGSEKLAIDALKEGAYDYFSKPFDLDELRAKVAKACERFALVDAKSNLEELLSGQPQSRLIGDTPGIRLVRERIAQVAPTDFTVLIQGESGTGKEVVAREIQAQSGRAKGPFVTLNCAALPENLIESELFGYERGAFTGAVGRKRGKFELADGGTLFLDEIGDMAANTQAKVLRAIQEGEIERLGGGAPVRVDVRLLAATHQDLKTRIADGRFREDLYYRINVVNILLPPLRERLDDLPALVTHFVARAAEKLGRPLKGAAPRAMAALARFGWPGNVRQLQNIIEGAAVFARGDQIELENLPDEIRLGYTAESDPEGGDVVGALAARIAAGSSLDAVLAQVERELIVRAMSETGGNQSRAAEKLGIKRGTLQYKLKTHQLG